MVSKVNSATRDPEQRRALAMESVLPMRESLVQQTGVIFGHLQKAVCSVGTMGTIMNIEQRNLHSMLDDPGNNLATVMGYIGCFIDNTDRDLNGSQLVDGSMTPGLCFAYCKKLDFKYFATQFGKYCFCGDTYGKYGSVNYTECNFTCAGDGGIDCGGTWHNSIYSVQKSTLPESAIPTQKYSGSARLVVPTARSDLGTTETFTLTVMVLSLAVPDSVTLNWRQMGSKATWNTQAFALKTQGRQVYTVAIGGMKQDFEYYVNAAVEGTQLYFPATSPDVPQTVIVV